MKLLRKIIGNQGMAILTGRLVAFMLAGVVSVELDERWPDGVTLEAGDVLVEHALEVGILGPGGDHAHMRTVFGPKVSLQHLGQREYSPPAWRSTTLEVLSAMMNGVLAMFAQHVILKVGDVLVLVRAHDALEETKLQQLVVDIRHQGAHACKQWNFLC